jgi:hypothetical protein
MMPNYEVFCISQFSSMAEFQCASSNVLAFSTHNEFQAKRMNKFCYLIILSPATALAVTVVLTVTFIMRFGDK